MRSSSRAVWASACASTGHSTRSRSSRLSRASASGRSGDRSDDVPRERHAAARPVAPRLPRRHLSPLLDATVAPGRLNDHLPWTRADVGGRQRHARAPFASANLRGGRRVPPVGAGREHLQLLPPAHPSRLRLAATLDRDIEAGGAGRAGHEQVGIGAHRRQAPQRVVDGRRTGRVAWGRGGAPSRPSSRSSHAAPRPARPAR